MKDLRSEIKDLLSRGQWYSTYEVAGYLHITAGRLISESAASARIRDLRKPAFGGHQVISRPRQGHTAWEYCIPTSSQQEA